MSKYVIDSATLTSIGDAVREKDGTTEAILVKDLASRISAIEVGGGDMPEEAFVVTGTCSYRFANGGWDWFIETYGNKITTENISISSNMFSGSTLTEIPFDLNFKRLDSAAQYHSGSYMFDSCVNLTSIPKINGLRPDAFQSAFSKCTKLRELSEESVSGIDWSYIESRTSSYSGSRAYTFSQCCSLRKFPMSFLAHGNPVASSSSTIYNYAFQNCYSLDELINIPIEHRNATWTSNAFSYTFSDCYRLKDVIFETNEDGSPIVINGWSKQTIDLGGNIGYVNSGNITTYNNGITADKEVKDDATYQALKNDPDWWTKDYNYSRYDHDSAVRTINSLPDLSGGAGGNTIKFRTKRGTKTDGGAVDTLTAEEIAVATAKGWTVTIS